MRRRRRKEAEAERRRTCYLFGAQEAGADRIRDVGPPAEGIGAGQEDDVKEIAQDELQASMVPFQLPA